MTHSKLSMIKLESGYSVYFITSYFRGVSNAILGCYDPKHMVINGPMNQNEFWNDHTHAAMARGHYMLLAGLDDINSRRKLNNSDYGRRVVVMDLPDTPSLFHIQGYYEDCERELIDEFNREFQKNPEWTEAISVTAYAMAHRYI